MRTQFATLTDFISKSQARAIADCLAGEEGEWFEAKMLSLAQTIAAMPGPYGQDGKGAGAIVYLHYFTHHCDWWITERDILGDEGQPQAFGYADIGYGPEAGYISITELIENGVEIDLHWEPRAVRDIPALADDVNG